MTRDIHNSAPGTDRAVAYSALLILAAWFAVVIVAGRAEAFEAGPGGQPLPVLAAFAGPPLLFAIAYRVSPRVRALALGLDLRLLTAVQAWRVLGLVFLAFYDFGLLPGLFAWPAGVGDGAVGVAAIFVLAAMLRNAPGWRRRVFWLNIAGLVDFVGAVGTGVLTSNSSIGVFRDAGAGASMGLLPLSLIPTFAVPLWIIAHMISLLQLRRPASG
jgi:hypothetical protein